MHRRPSMEDALTIADEAIASAPAKGRMFVTAIYVLAMRAVDQQFRLAAFFAGWLRLWFAEEARQAADRTPDHLPVSDLTPTVPVLRAHAVLTAAPPASPAPVPAGVAS